MADVPMTRAEAVKLIEAHEHVVRRWAGAHHDKIEEAADEQLQSREALIAALTRPAPSPSDGEAEALLDALIHARDALRKGFTSSASDEAAYREARQKYDTTYAAVLARLRGAAVPEGWSIVPDEPTKEMRKAAGDLEAKSAAENYGGSPTADEYWHAMIAAAPEVPR